MDWVANGHKYEVEANFVSESSNAMVLEWIRC